MFSNLNKPTFGTSTASTSFGLGTSTANTVSPWGTTGNTQPFGKPTTTAFGQQPSTFGQATTTSNTMFPFFPQSNSSGFGSTTSTQSFGSNVFGQQQSASNNLFGSNTFGQQKPASFGFGAQNQQQPNLFGQPAQPQSSLFQPSGSSSIFNSSGAFGSSTVGTTIKFNPVTGTDTMQKSGVTSSINTKHHCITCMKEYESKSLEELRLEDYQANRKGPQSQFGATPFGGTSTMFGQNSENKTAFGQATPFGQIGSTPIAQSFGQQGQAFGLNTPQSASNTIFGKPPAFGATGSTANGFGAFNTSPSVANTFGANQSKPFGTTTATPLFGTAQPAQQATPFGSSLFGQNNQQSKPAFGTTSSGAFGQTAPAFGQPAQQNTFGASTFGKSLTFGQNQNTFQPAVGQSSLFSNTQQKPGSLLVNNSVGLFGTNTFGTNAPSGFSLAQNNMQLQGQGFSLESSQDSKNLPLLASNQFGHSPFLKGLVPIEKPSSPSVYTTNPAEIKKMLESNKKIDETSNMRLKLKLGPPKTQRDNLFSETTDDEANKFYKTSCKRLVLKKKPGESKQSIFETASIYTEWADKNTSIQVQASGDPSNISEVNSSEINLDSVTRRGENTETKLFDQHLAHAKKGLVKLASTKTDKNNSSIGNTAHTLIENTMGRMELLKSLEEPSRKGSSDACVSTMDSENNPQSPLAIRMSTEVPPSALIEPQGRTGPSGITLNRAEYYTLPSIDELDQIVNEDGRCMVRGFTVGRKGYGNVHFPDELNVRNLNLDDIVHFRFKEIHMYPDESKKPPIGEGLNRRAQVTLDRVFPRVKETKEVIDDVDQVLAAKFPEQLVEISAKHGLKFIDYRPETGSWVFMVEHFSKYAFTESDEEDCELSLTTDKEVAGLKKTSSVLRKKKKQPLADVEESEQTHTAKPDLMMEQMNTDLVSEYTDEGDQRQGDLLHKSMVIDLEGDDDEFINPMYEHTDQDLYYHNSQIQMLKAAFFSDSECATSLSSVDYFGANYKSDLFDLKSKGVQRKPPHRPKVYQIFVNIVCRENESILLKANRCYSDLGVFKGCAYKVGWAGGCKNFAIKYPCSSDVTDPYLSLTLNAAAATNTNETLQKAIIECMNLAKENSVLTFDGKESIPTYAIKKDRQFLEACYAVFEKICQKSNDRSELLYNDIWSLCYALWGPGRRTAPFVKSRLSTWLKTSVQDKIMKANKYLKKHSIKDKLELIFNRLTCFNVGEAAEIAMDAEMPSLALIISQVNLPSKPKTIIAYQLESWYNDMYSDYISTEMIKIYSLLSGCAFDRNVNIFEDLEWKRSFGLYLWYLTDNCSSSELAVDVYTKGFRGSSYAAEPRPQYACEIDEETKAYDVLFHILQIYKSPIYRLVKALNPETYTYVKTDYQLSWLLLMFFQSIGVGLIDPSEEMEIHCSLSAQLEETGLWDVAILPLLYIKDSSVKKNLILGILNRYMPIDVSEADAIETKLVEEFNVPQSWIATIRNEKKNYMNSN